MNKTAVLSFVVAVLAVQGGLITVTGDLVPLLEPGTTGQIFHEFTMGEQAREVDVGTVEVVSIEGTDATLRPLGEGSVRPGFSVRFEVPYDRVRDETLPETIGDLESRIASSEAAHRALSTRYETLATSFEQVARGNYELMERVRSLRARLVEQSAGGERAETDVSQPMIALEDEVASLRKTLETTEYRATQSSNAWALSQSKLERELEEAQLAQVSLEEGHAELVLELEALRAEALESRDEGEARGLENQRLVSELGSAQTELKERQESFEEEVSRADALERELEEAQLAQASVEEALRAEALESRNEGEARGLENESLVSELGSARTELKERQESFEEEVSRADALERDLEEAKVAQASLEEAGAGLALELEALRAEALGSRNAEEVLEIEIERLVGELMSAGTERQELGMRLEDEVSRGDALANRLELLQNKRQVLGRRLTKVVSRRAAMASEIEQLGEKMQLLEGEQKTLETRLEALVWFVGQRLLESRREEAAGTQPPG